MVLPSRPLPLACWRPCRVTTRLVPFGEHQTWVQITTPETARPRRPPLFVLHGGPGWHTTTSPTSPRWPTRPAARSSTTTRSAAATAPTCPTHPPTSGHRSCSSTSSTPSAPPWASTATTCSGQSWGGMLGAEIAVRRPRGPGLAVDLQLPRLDAAVGRGRRRACGPSCPRYPGRPGTPRDRRHRHRSGVPGRDDGVLLRGHVLPRDTDAAGLRRHRSRRWWPSRQCTTP